MIWDHCTWGGVWQDHISTSPTHLNVVFLSFIMEELFHYLSGLFQRKNVLCVADLGYLWEEVNSGSSYTSIFRMF